MKPRRRIAFDPDHPDIDESRFKAYDWVTFIVTLKKRSHPMSRNLWANQYNTLFCGRKFGRECCCQTESDENFDIAQSCSSGLALQKAKHRRIEYFWVRDCGFEERD
jgi:hypothetical protein